MGSEVRDWVTKKHMCRPTWLIDRKADTSIGYLSDNAIPSTERISQTRFNCTETQVECTTVAPSDGGMHIGDFRWNSRPRRKRHDFFPRGPRNTPGGICTNPPCEFRGQVSLLSIHRDIHTPHNHKWAAQYINVFNGTKREGAAMQRATVETTVRQLYMDSRLLNMHTISATAKWRSKYLDRKLNVMTIAPTLVFTHLFFSFFLQTFYQKCWNKVSYIWNQQAIYLTIELNIIVTISSDRPTWIVDVHKLWQMTLVRHDVRSVERLSCTGVSSSLVS